MTKRIILAGLAAGLAVFLWEAVAHMATPLGTTGWKTFPEESLTLTVLGRTVQRSGLYIFPAPRPDGSPVPGNWPSGLLLLHTKAMPELTPAQLMTQFAGDVAVMLLVAFLLSRFAAGASFGAQFLFVVSLTLFTGFRSDLPNWNWYGYPRSFLLAGYITEFVGFAIAGVILPRVLHSGAKAKAARA